MSDTPTPVNGKPMVESAPSVPVVEAAAAEEVPAVAAPKAPEAPKAPQASAQFAALAKKEKAILAQQKALKQQQAELQAKMEELNKYSSLRDEVKSNPLKALDAFGLDYKTLTDFILNNNAPTAEHQVKEVKEEILKLRQEREAELKKQEELAAQRADAEKSQAITDFKSEIKSFITENAAEYELMNIYEGSDEIMFTTIEDYYAQTGKILSIEEAAKLVEEYIADQAMKAAQAKKIQAKLSPPKADPQAKPAATPSKTLSNAISSAPSMLPARTENDRLQRAMARLNGG